MHPTLEAALRSSIEATTPSPESSSHMVQTEALADTGSALVTLPEVEEPQIVPVTDAEAHALLQGVIESYDRERLSLYLADAKQRMVSPIINAFGLAKVIFNDKDGGNVTTPHNADLGIFASAEDQARYQLPFDRRNYEPSGGFKSKRKAILKSPDPISDAYTGKPLPRDGRTHIDHVISAKNIHDDRWLRLATDIETRRTIATQEQNLSPTGSSINQSKGEKPLKKWIDIRRPDGQSNEQFYEINRDMASQEDAKARGAYRREWTKGISAHFGSEIARTGAKEAASMGAQQAVGLLMMELSQAMWDEARDAFANGLCTDISDTAMHAISLRLRRVGTRVVARWRDAVAAFRDGAIAGFLSNVITFVTNIFFTTLKNAAHMIREGLASLLRALKMIFSPPSGLTRAEVYHEASKLMLAGVAVSLGVAAEEFVHKAVLAVPVLNMFATEIAAVLTGIVTGLSIAGLCYVCDRLDLFGAEQYRRHAFVMQALETRIEIAQAQSRISVDQRSVWLEETEGLAAESDSILTAFREMQSALTDCSQHDQNARSGEAVGSAGLLPSPMHPKMS